MGKIYVEFNIFHECLASDYHVNLILLQPRGEYCVYLSRMIQRRRNFLGVLKDSGAML